LDFYEKENIIEHLEKFKASSGEWDVYRKKIPAPLLEKLTLILRECRKNGFISPRVFNGEIKWQQVEGFRRNFKNADECSVCDRNQTKGTCDGRFIYKGEQRMFVPCWIGGN